MRRRNRSKSRKAPVAQDKEDKCSTPYCRNARARNGKYRLQNCWKCRSRKMKENHPVTYVLNMIRHSARKRKLPFSLTTESFAAFCKETGYLEKRGTKPGNLTLDRKDWNDGYHIWNLRVETHAANSEQGADNTPREERGCKTLDENEPF